MPLFLVFQEGLNALESAQKTAGASFSWLVFCLRKLKNRVARKSAWLGVYKLTNAGMADEFLRRHGSAVAAPLQQPEFGLQLPTNLAALAN